MSYENIKTIAEIDIIINDLKTQYNAYDCDSLEKGYEEYCVNEHLKALAEELAAARMRRERLLYLEGNEPFSKLKKDESLDLFIELDKNEYIKPMSKNKNKH